MAAARRFSEGRVRYPALSALRAPVSSYTDLDHQEDEHPLCESLGRCYLQPIYAVRSVQLVKLLLDYSPMLNLCLEIPT
jgi:hypothetical protein